MGCFQELSNDKVETFFQQMFLSDITMPHTHNFLSPITFAQFLDRNQIRTFNPLAIYDEANTRWRRLVSANPDIIEGGDRKGIDMDMAEQPSENSWHILIDFFRRVLNVVKVKDLYYSMHYLAHVFREFLGASSQLSDPRTMVCTRAIFTQMTGPVLYDSIVPAQYFFLPVKNYTDATYPSGLRVMVNRVNNYVTGHTAQIMQIEKLDGSRSEAIKNELHSALSKIVKYKRNSKKVDETMTNLANTMKIYKIDQDAYEMSDTFVRDGVKSAIAINALNKLGDKFVSGKLSHDPNDLIDILLDVWNIVNPPKKETLLSKIGSVFKKPKTEEMDNDIAAIKRERKFDPT